MDPHESAAQALALLRSGRLEEAEAALAPLDEALPARRALIEGLIAERSGNLERALSRIGRAVQLDSEDVDALLALASVQLALDHPAFAVIPAQRAAKRAPARADAYAVLATAQQRIGRPEAALAVIRRGAVAAGMASGMECALPEYRTLAAEIAASVAKLGDDEDNKGDGRKRTQAP